MARRPVFDKLPVRGYQDNVTVDALLQFYEEKLVATGNAVQGLHLNLNPTTCPANYLDWLAFMVGMVPPYYSYGWKEAVKRKAIVAANDVFKYRGTEKALRMALDVHSFTYGLYTSDDLKLPFVFGNTTSRFGKKSSTAYVQLPLKYTRNGYEFRETQKALDNYSAVATPVISCYDKFYIGFSVFGDPLF
jgi:phage tail-like protein